MFLKSIRIQNFKAIDDISINFSSDYNILVGQNGIGKTSILEATNMALRFIVSQLIGISNSRFTPAYVRIGTNISKFSLEIELMDEVFQFELIGKKTSSGLQLSPNSSTSYTRLRKVFSQEMERLDESNLEENLFWPLVAFYNQMRSNFNIVTVKSKNLAKDAYTEDNGIISHFQKWFDDRDAEEARIVRNTSNLKHKDPQLEAARKVIADATGFKSIFYSKKSPEGIKVKKDGFEISFDQMSSGEKSILYLMGDLARKCGLLNNDKPFDVKGIVLIDEIDMHLHPIWQRQVVSTLTRFFPNIQFIITTHSPQVIGEVHSENIRILSKTRSKVLVKEFSQSSYGRDSNYLIETVLGGDLRKKELKKQLTKIDKLIATNKLDEAKSIILKVENIYGDNLPEIAIAEARIKRRMSKK